MQSKTHGFATAQDQVPLCAVVFYGNDDGKQAHTGYATHHLIRETDTRYELAPGSSLTSQNFEKIAAMVTNGMRHKAEILPDNILVSSDNLLVWWKPAGLQQMHFDVSNGSSMEDRKRLQGVNGKFPLPALVFMLNRSKTKTAAYLGISVFALAENTRPDPSTNLFRAPVLNINEQGSVCWGNGVKPKGRAVSDIPAWQSLFFSSVFTHYNNSSPIKGEDCYGFIANLLETGATSFPVESLISMKQKLQHVVDSMSENSRG